MSQEEQEKLDSVLEHVRTNRRGFLRRLLIGSAGAAAAFVPLSGEVSAHRWFNRNSKAGKGKDPTPWYDRGEEGSLW